MKYNYKNASKSLVNKQGKKHLRLSIYSMIC